MLTPEFGTLELPSRPPVAFVDVDLVRRVLLQKLADQLVVNARKLTHSAERPEKPEPTIATRMVDVRASRGGQWR